MQESIGVDVSIETIESGWALPKMLSSSLKIGKKLPSKTYCCRLYKVSTTVKLLGIIIANFSCGDH